MVGLRLKRFPWCSTTQLLTPRCHVSPPRLVNSSQPWPFMGKSEQRKQSISIRSHEFCWAQPVRQQWKCNHTKCSIELLRKIMLINVFADVLSNLKYIMNYLYIFSLIYHTHIVIYHFVCIILCEYDLHLGKRRGHKLIFIEK